MTCPWLCSLVGETGYRVVCVAGSSHSPYGAQATGLTPWGWMEARFVISNCAAYDVHGRPKNTHKTVPVTCLWCLHACGDSGILKIWLHHAAHGILVPCESCSVVSDSATPWTVQCMEFSRPEYWSGYPFPSPGDHPNPGIEPRSSILQRDKYIKTKINWRAKVEWWFPEVGRMEIMGSYCLMGTEFQFGKMNSSKDGQW